MKLEGLFISLQNKWLMQQTMFSFNSTQGNIFSFVFLLKTVADACSFPSPGWALPLLKRCLSVIVFTEVFPVYSGERAVAVAVGLLPHQVKVQLTHCKSSHPELSQYKQMVR